LKYFQVLFLFLVIVSNVRAQEIYDSLRTYNLGEVEITSSRNGLINKASVSEIENVLEKRTGIDIAKAFEHLTGMFYAPTSKNESKIYLRGFDQADVSVMIDGVPIYQPYDGLVDFSNLPANSFSKIIIAKGMSSVLYGSNSMGGAINLITKEPVKNFSAEIGFETGNTNIFSAGVNGKYANLYYSFDGSYSRSGGYKLSKDFSGTKNENGELRDNSRFENTGAMFKIGIKDIYGFDAAYSLMLINNSKGIPVDVYTSKPRFWKFSEWRKNINNLMFRRLFADKAVIKGNFYYEKFFNVLNAYDDASYSTQTKPFAFHSVYDDYSYGANLSSAFSIIEQGLTKGYFAYRRDVHSEQGNYNQAFKKYEAEELTIGFEQEINLIQNLSSVAGIGYSYLNPVYANGANLRSSVSSLNYNFGIGFRLFDDVNVHAAVSYKNRFPVLREFYSETKGLEISNPDLNPEFAFKIETGIEYYYYENNTLSLVFFRSDVKDLIKQVNVTGGLRQFQNVGKALFTGIEVTTGFLKNNFSINFNYTYLLAENKTNNTATDILEYRPKHVLSITSGYLFNFGLQAEAEYFFSAKEYGVNLENLNFVDMPNRGIINLMVSQSLINKSNLYLRMNNVADIYYESEYAFPQPGREFIAGIKISL